MIHSTFFMTLCSSFLFLLCSITASAAQTSTFLEQLRRNPPVPGGVAVVQLQTPATSEPPALWYEDKRVLVLYDDFKNQWFAIVGISLDAPLGMHAVLESETGARYNFQVFDKEYETQRLTLQNKRQVNPNPDDLARIKREVALIRGFLAAEWRATGISPLPFSRPAQGRFSSPFGLRRFFNGEPRQPHKGLDIAAPQGTPVVAPADGIVLNTGDYFFNGHSIFLDHGYGVVTMYCHLHEIRVQTGQSVKRGQLIGTVGMTGRSTGAHLHWGVSLNNTWIDPMLVLQE